MHLYLTENQLSRCRTNHNVGLRVTSLKCAIRGCPKVNRLLTLLYPLEEQHPYQLQELEGQGHNHQAEVAPHRGMTLAQKEVIRLCIDRGQSAPKKVNKTSIYSIRRSFLTQRKTFIWLKYSRYLQADSQRIHQDATGCRKEQRSTYSCTKQGNDIIIHILPKIINKRWCSGRRSEPTRCS